MDTHKSCPKFSFATYNVFPFNLTFFLPISILCLFQQVISTQDSFFIFTCHFLSNIYVRSQGCLYNPFLCSFLEKEEAIPLHIHGGESKENDHYYL